MSFLRGLFTAHFHGQEMAFVMVRGLDDSMTRPPPKVSEPALRKNSHLELLLLSSCYHVFFRALRCHLHFHSIAIGWRLKNTFKGQSQSGRLHLDAFARERYFETTIVRFLEIKTELVLLDCPFANFLRSH